MQARRPIDELPDEDRRRGRSSFLLVATMVLVIAVAVLVHHHDDIFRSALTDPRGNGIVRLMLAIGQDPNGETDGVSALMQATFKPPAYGAVVNVRALLEAGADPNRPDRLGRTPLLSFYCGGGDASQQVRLLLEHGADPNRVEPSGRSIAACLPARTGDEAGEDDLRALLAHGLDPCLIVARGAAAPTDEEPLRLRDALDRRSLGTVLRPEGERNWLPLSLDAHLAGRGYSALAKEVRALCAAKAERVLPEAVR